jgi:hypothetical protein
MQKNRNLLNVLYDSPCYATVLKQAAAIPMSITLLLLELLHHDTD